MVMKLDQGYDKDKKEHIATFYNIVTTKKQQ